MESKRRMMYVEDMLREVMEHNIKGEYTLSFKIEDYYGDDLLSITDGDFENGLVIRVRYLKEDFKVLIDAFKELLDYTRREK
jgi:5-hydroxyisourate hydrolase-like protein (transthyretin family)